MFKINKGKLFSLIKDMYLYMTSILKRNKKISEELFLFSSGKGQLNRNEFDVAVGKEISLVHERAKSLPSISAIYRVKNGAEYIESAILSVAPLVTEIIVIDNGSKDETKSIVAKLKKELRGIVRIEIHDYTIKTVLAGDGYYERVKLNPEGSLAKFYEYCFSLGTSEYLMKCDAHYVFTLKGLISLQDKLKYSPDVINFSGCEIYGKELDYEPSLFRRDSGYKFVDKEKWEKLEIPNAESIYVYSPVFLHVKRLSYVKGIQNSEKNFAEFKYEK
ncbi:glycosyltransferase [Vibrio alginolyticus]|uniref:glycosyltransferase n=1 Tax=Vibrio alginolyticus TaxID=663 RepID=UPI002FEED0FA